MDLFDVNSKKEYEQSENRWIYCLGNMRTFLSNILHTGWYKTRCIPNRFMDENARSTYTQTHTHTPHTIQCLSNMRERDSNAQLDENVCIPLVIVISLSWNQLWFWCCAESTRLNLVAHGIRKLWYFIKDVTIWTKENINDLNVVRSIYSIKLEYLKRNSK